ncbi:MAG: LytTR family DNA-binding domain-containing protein [Petrimonas mucosa]|mgnify:FL=1|jgi:hypothetical protein|nr:LytTR family DNA-binding domain-containing protein [Petrimonas mucosa]
MLAISGLCIVYATVQAWAFGWLVSFPFLQLMLDGMVNGLCLTALSYLLWKVIKYGNFETLEFYQRLINYAALGLLSIAIWTGLCYLSAYSIFDPDKWSEAISMLPLKAFIALLIYLLMIQLFRMGLAVAGVESQRQTEEETEEEIAGMDNHRTEEIEMLERIVVKSGQKIDVIRVAEIVYFQAEGDYVRIFTDSGKYLKEETMKYFQSHLPDGQFIRVHRSYLVNTSKILRIELYEKQNQLLTLSNGDKIKISASGYKRLREKLGL